jgi:hypothetical protein
MHSCVQRLLNNLQEAQGEEPDPIFGVEDKYYSNTNKTKMKQNAMLL